jgi:signal transduction histidine kinase
MDEPLLTAGSKEAFFQYNRHFRIASFKVGCILVIGLMPAGFLLDCFVYPKEADLFLSLRLICSFLAMILWGLLNTPWGRGHFRMLGMLCFILPSLFISIMIYSSDGVTSSYYAGLNLVLIGMTWAAQVDFIESAIAAVLTLVMYCVACFAHGNVIPSVLFNNLYFIVLTGIIVMTGSYYVNRLRYREFALRAELDFNRNELEASNLKLVEMDRAKSEFFANISHELRTPLTLLIGPLEKLRMDRAKTTVEQQSELLEIMYGNAMRLLRLINDLLSLVRLDSGSLVLRKERIELKPFIEGLARSVTPMAQQCQLKFETRVMATEDTIAYIDRDKFEKILYNLLFNAFKFTPPQGSVDLLVETQEGGQLEMTVRDSGVGILPADLERIFDRFWQAEASTTRRYQGVGIGLALVKELATVHGGHVFAESEPGRGTTMKVRLDVSTKFFNEPIALPNETPRNEENAAWLNGLYRRAELFPAHVVTNSEAPASQAVASEDTSRILIVDDEPDMRRFLHSQLQDRYDVQEARNGAEAMEIARTEDFSLILLDFMMPNMDGIEVMRQLRESPLNQTTPIIILTARADEDFKITTLRAGATDFLTKPFSSTELMVRARNIIAAHQLQKQLVRKTSQLEEALVLIKETESQLVHQAKMASLGQLSAGLMHEINNPLNFANTAFHILKKRLSAATIEPLALMKPLADIQDGIQRVVTITTSLRDFTHPDDSTFRPVNLTEVVASAIRFVQINRQQISLKVQIEPSIHLWGNSNQLVHLFINLLQNSIDSLHEKGGPSKEIRIDASLRGDQVETIFHDNGKGIAPDHLARVYDAFFTTKKVGSGVGLGLNICHRIVQQHKGQIFVESKENEYCQFRLIFPSSTQHHL